MRKGVITSIINIPNLPLSYTNIRSTYTYNQRFEQTKKTIQTIRDNIPDCKIMLVEYSELNDEHNTFLNDNVDYFLNLFENKTLMNDIYGKSKSLGKVL